MRAPLLLGLTGLLALTACDGLFGPDDRPPSRIDRSPIPGTQTAGAVVAVTVTVLDEDGNPLGGEEVAWVPAGGGSVEPEASQSDREGKATTAWTLGTTAGSQSLTARARELETTFTVTARPGPLAELTVTPGSGTMESLGDTLRLVAAGADEYGNTVQLHDLTWSSSRPEVAEVTVGGAVVSRGEGVAEIVASMAGASATVPVVVDQVLTGIAVDLWTNVLARGESYALTARPVDARGATVDTTLAVGWSSSNAAAATVTAAGILDAVDPGAAVITASAPPVSGELAVTVKAGPRPEVTGVSPAVLVPGGVATITGTGFAATAGQNQVTVAGAPATVTSAGSGQLTVTLPGSGAFPCGPTGPQEVRVTVDELAARAEHPVSGATRRQLAVGEAVVLDHGEIGCNEVVGAGSYVMTVFNATPAAGAITSFEVRGLDDEAAAAAPFTASLSSPQRLRVAATAPAPRSDPEVEAHLRMLDRNRALLEQLGTPPSERLPQLRVSAAPAVGTLRTFRIPDLDASGLCGNYETVTARVAFAGERGVVYEDTLAPLAGTMDSTWRKVGEEFDAVMYPVLLEYFGDPLILDGQLDADGRFNMLFSEAVNEFEAGVAGFVFSGDFFPRADCGSSNHGEIFYGRVPTATGSGYDANTVDAWYWGIRSTVIHEVKHITSYAHKIRDAGTGVPNYEEQWLEESTARLSEEFYARALFGYGQGQNVDYDSSVYGEVRVGERWPEYDHLPSIMQKHFGGAYDYLGAIETRSPIGKVGENDWSFYGSGWLFVRWALDRSGVPEADFVRALVDEDDVSGVANIEERTGRSFRDLVGNFSLALATDDHPSGFTAADPAHTHPSWNTRDIFAGLHEDFGESYDPPWPLRTTTLPSGSFVASVPTLRGGSTSVFELTLGAGGSQLLRVLAEGGGTAPAALGMAIVRVQ